MQPLKIIIRNKSSERIFNVPLKEVKELSGSLEWAVCFDIKNTNLTIGLIALDSLTVNNISAKLVFDNVSFAPSLDPYGTAKSIYKRDVLINGRIPFKLEYIEPYSQIEIILFPYIK